MINIIDNKFMTSLVDQLRHTGTEPAEFYRITLLISQLLTYEALKDEEYNIEDIPMWTGEQYPATVFDQKRIVIMPILRAGIGMLDGARHLLPAAQVQILGMYRNEETLQPVWYYNKLPKNMDRQHAILIDPMLATGGTLVDAVQELKKHNCGRITILAIVASPEGIERLEKETPDVQVFVAAKDDHLNDNGYILPGLGDAGDRIFNT
ncbi:MAG: uracil phosphoribosyltransferase [Candidatus Cloacimonetes bacterium]|nr:uracil phosphoribosyltransferase [Candidatus Cloacimonadota bacterium]